MKERIVDIADLDLLTPGSIWIRESGKQSRFLFLTNQTLPISMQDKHPQMVIYADEDDNVMSTPLDAFLAKRTYHIIDPGLEQRLENLLALDDGESNDSDTFDLMNDGPDDVLSIDGDDDDLVLEDDSEIATGTLDELIADTPVKATVVDDGLRLNPFPVSYFAEGTGLPEIISPQKLSEMTESYQQLPLVDAGKLQHILYVREVPGITTEMLRACFSPHNIEDNAVYTFKVDLPSGALDIDWDEFVGVYPYVFQAARMHQVIFTTNNVVIEVLSTEEIDVPDVLEENVVFASERDAYGIPVISATHVTPAAAPSAPAAPEPEPEMKSMFEAPAAATDDGFNVSVVDQEAAPVADAGFVVNQS